MKRPFISRRGRGAVMLITAAAALMLSSGAAQAAGPGSHTQAEVNASIEQGVAYIDTQQNLNGSYGTTEPIAETGMTLVAYSVLANGKFENLSATYQAHVKKAIEWLLTQQEAAGDWADAGVYQTYSTGIAIAGLEPFKEVNAGIPAAIKKGREFLEGEFKGNALTGCSSEEGSSTAFYCGGWNYDNPVEERSDESNTGYALFGLHQTGGIPATIAKEDLGWQHHVQVIKSNPFATRNDGGGSYQPAYAGVVSGFSSNANDTGSMLFGFGYDGLTTSDEGVKAGITFGEDILNEYELEKEVSREMISHSGEKEDGTCKIGAAGCDWEISGDGGYHYSQFALTKGLGEFIAPKLEEASNWYAKVVDLLLTQQETSGSWPQDGRDDASVVFATALSVSSLGLVGLSASTETSTSLSGAGQSGPSIEVPEGSEVTDQATVTGTNSGQAGGTVTYKVYYDDECKIPYSEDTVNVNDGVVEPSESYFFEAGKTYYWTATYSGDKANKESASKCGEEQLTVLAEPHWLSNGRLIAGYEPQTVRSQGELTLHVGEEALTCKVKDKGVIANPGEFFFTEGAGFDEVTEARFLDCSGGKPAPPCPKWGSKCSSKPISPCPKGSKLETFGRGLPWQSHLTAGPPIRDVIEGVKLELRCSNGTILGTYSGTLMPEVGPSRLEFGSGSGELEDPAGAKATVTGKDKLEGPPGDEKITAQLPPGPAHWYSNGQLIPEGQEVFVTSSGKLTFSLEVPAGLVADAAPAWGAKSRKVSVTCELNDEALLENPLGGGLGYDETLTSLSNCRGKCSPCGKGGTIEIEGGTGFTELAAGPPITDLTEMEVVVKCNGTEVGRYEGIVTPLVDGNTLKYGYGFDQLFNENNEAITVTGKDKLEGPPGDEWISAKSPTTD